MWLVDAKRALKVDQRRLFRQPRIGAHEEVLAGIGGKQRLPVVDLDPAVGHPKQHRLGDDAFIQCLHHLFFKLVGAFRQCQRSCVFVHCQLAFPARICATDSIASTIA
jgi:hypothetical protein